MNVSVAFCFGDELVYWSSIITTLAAVSCFSVAAALYSSHSGRGSTVWVMFPFAVLFSVFFCRLLHWYCNPGIYRSLFKAVTDISEGGFCIAGILPGVLLAAFVTVRLGFAPDGSLLLDAVGPGLSLGIALIRLSAVFNDSCRGRVCVTDPRFMRMPFSMPADAEHRFCVFFADFALMLIVTVILLNFYYNCRTEKYADGEERSGTVFRLSVVLISCVEMACDFARCDASNLHLIKSFSVVRVLSAAFVIVNILHFSAVAVRCDNGRRAGVLFTLAVVSLAVLGVCEFLQISWLLCAVYSGFSLILFLSAFGLYRSCL